MLLFGVVACVEGVDPLGLLELPESGFKSMSKSKSCGSFLAALVLNSLIASSKFTSSESESNGFSPFLLRSNCSCVLRSLSISSLKSVDLGALGPCAPSTGFRSTGDSGEFPVHLVEHSLNSRDEAMDLECSVSNSVLHRCFRLRLVAKKHRAHQHCLLLACAPLSRLACEDR